MRGWQRPVDAMQDSALTNSTASVDLVLQYQAGNDKALDRLWARYLPRLRRWARGRLPPAGRGGTDTEDLVQDAFVRSLAHLRTLKPRAPQSVFAYVKNIVLNQVRDHLRQLSRRPMGNLCEASPLLDEAPSPLELAIGREHLERYERALASLRKDDQDLVLAVVELSLSDQEIAEWFEKPSLDAARMARGRALARLARNASS
jgi:RNA polymerase sigma-70 factor (ECF subfamily)